MISDGGPLVLDGGLATDLEAHGAKLQVNLRGFGSCVIAHVTF